VTSPALPSPEQPAGLFAGVADRFRNVAGFDDPSDALAGVSSSARELDSVDGGDGGGDASSERLAFTGGTMVETT